MKAYWYGQTHILSDEYKFQVDGALVVFDDGDYEFEIAYKNRAVKAAEQNNAAFNLGALDAISKNY